MTARYVAVEPPSAGVVWPVPGGWAFRSADGGTTGTAGSYEAACVELVRIESERARKERTG